MRSRRSRAAAFCLPKLAQSRDRRQVMPACRLTAAASSHSRWRTSNTATSASRRATSVRASAAKQLERPRQSGDDLSVRAANLGRAAHLDRWIGAKSGLRDVSARDVDARHRGGHFRRVLNASVTSSDRDPTFSVEVGRLRRLTESVGSAGHQHGHEEAQLRVRLQSIIGRLHQR